MGVAAEKIHAPQSEYTSTLPNEKQVDAFVDLLKDKPLPIFQQTLDQLKQFDGKPNVSIPKIIEILRLDPCYSHNVFVTANAGLIKSKRAPAAALEHAILILGVPSVINMGKDLPLISDQKNPQTKNRISQILSRSYHAGIQAKEWMFDHGKSSAETAFITAQLSNIYIAGLWFYAPDEISGLIKSTSQKELFDHNWILTETGKELSKKWHFSDLLQQSLDQNSDTSRLVQIVRFANNIARLAESGWYTKPMEHFISESSPMLGYPEDLLIQRSHRNAVMAARETMFYPIKPAACRLLELDAPIEDTEAPVEKIIVKKPKVVQSKSAPKQVSENKSKLQILSEMGTNNSSAREILKLSLKILSNLPGKNPVAFFLLDKNKTVLKSRFISNFSDQKKTMFLPINKKNIFLSLIQKPQSTWVNQKNRARYTALLPSDLPLKVREKDFMSISLFIKNKPIGLYYLESTDNQPLSPQIYNQFISICKTANAALDEVNKHAN